MEPTIKKNETIYGIVCEFNLSFRHRITGFLYDETNGSPAIRHEPDTQLMSGKMNQTYSYMHICKQIQNKKQKKKTEPKKMNSISIHIYDCCSFVCLFVCFCKKKI